MNIRIQIIAALGVTAALMLTGCASSPDPPAPVNKASEPAEAAAPEKSAVGSMSGPSDFDPCPDGVAAGMDSISSSEWHDIEVSEVILPEGVEFPVPSCAVSNTEGTMVSLVYIGADLTLFDELDAQLVANDFVADEGTSEEFSSYTEGQMRTFIDFRYAPTVDPRYSMSKFLGAPHVVVSISN